MGSENTITIEPIPSPRAFQHVHLPPLSNTPHASSMYISPAFLSKCECIRTPLEVLGKGFHMIAWNLGYDGGEMEMPGESSRWFMRFALWGGFLDVEGGMPRGADALV